MKAKDLKSYVQVGVETTPQEALKLFEEDANYIAENFPQLFRHFNMVFCRIHDLEDGMEFIKKSFVELNATLRLLEKLTSLHGDIDNDTKH